MTHPTTQVQTWAETLRLPLLTVVAECEPLLGLTEPYRRPAIPLQSKHLPTLKRSLCFVLRRPADKSRSGLIVVWPQRGCCVFVTCDVRPRMALLRLRVDQQFLAYGSGPTILSATLSPSERTIFVEDVLMWKGADCLQTQTFSERWRLAVQWNAYFCTADEQLLGGLRMVLAPWSALDTMAGEGVWNIQCDTAGSRRLLWFPVSPKKEAPVSKVASQPAKETTRGETETTTRVTAKRGASPDQWTIIRSNGVELGRALIRGITISKQLREATGDMVSVEAKWNATFDKWEVVSVILSASK